MKCLEFKKILSMYELKNTLLFEYWLQAYLRKLKNLIKEEYALSKDLLYSSIIKNFSSSLP